MAVDSITTTKTYSPAALLAAEALTGIVFHDPDHLVVEHWASGATSGTVLARDVDYTIGGTGATGAGTITAMASWPVADQFRVRRETPASQPEVLPPYEPLSSADIERALDRGALHDQEQDRELARTLMVPRGETLAALPVAAARANAVLVGNEAGGFTAVPLDELGVLIGGIPIGTSAVWSDSIGSRSQAIITNGNGAAIVEGGYPVDFAIAADQDFTRFYAKIVSGTVGSTCAISVLGGGLLYGPVTVTYGTPEDDVITITVPAGQDVIYLVEDITGTITMLVAKLEGPAA